MPNYLGFSKLIEHAVGNTQDVATQDTTTELSKSTVTVINATKAISLVVQNAQDAQDALSTATQDALIKAIADAQTAKSAIEIGIAAAADTAQLASELNETTKDALQLAKRDAASDTAKNALIKAIADAQTEQTALTKALEQAQTAQYALAETIKTAQSKILNNILNTPDSTQDALNKILNTPASTQDTLNKIIPSIINQQNNNVIQINAPYKTLIETYYVNKNPNFRTQIPLYVANTKRNSNGNQEFDASQFANNKGQFNIIIGILDNETLELIDSTNSSINYKIKRRGDQISVNGGSLQSYNSFVVIGNNKYVYSGAGSPIVFKVIYEDKTQLVTPATPVAPVTLFDYLFMYSYFIGFIGAILYSVGSLITIDVPSVMMNRSVSLVMNIYISICGFISICTWFNLDINNIISYNLFNQDVVVPIFK